MTNQCSVTAVGYGGAACNGINMALKGTANEGFIKAASEYALEMFHQLTSPHPLVPEASQKFAAMHTDHSAHFSPSAVTGISGKGHSLA